MDRGLDEVWRTVREVLGTAARDGGPAIAAFPARAADHLTEAAGRLERAAATGVPDQPAGFGPDGEIVATARSSSYVRGRDLIDEVDYIALRQARGKNQRMSSSPTFEEIQRLQGFDGPHTIVAKSAIDAVVTRKRPALYRGFEEERYRDAFVAGPVRPGGGTTGYGTYATPLEEVALHYADPTRRSDPAARQARVLRMALRPEANVIGLRALESERRGVMAQIDRDLRDVRNIARPTTEDTTRYVELMEMQLVVGDLGQYGALRGYDVIDGSDTFRNQEWNILNPTALMVQR
ncbi:hypothetical protein ACWCPQ_13475 [Nocardia sp. NPDC001965]